MKKIYEALKAIGIEIPSDKKEDFEKSVKESFVPIKEFNDQKEQLEAAQAKVTASETTINGLKEDLKKFDGKDVAAMEQRIKDLEDDNRAKDDEYAQKIADRDFDDLLSESIRTAKGRNAKAIRALLDVETLKKSKNQKDDVAVAIKALTEAEDSKMLFGESGTIKVGTVIGAVTKPEDKPADTLKSALAEHYKK